MSPLIELITGAKAYGFGSSSIEYPLIGFVALVSTTISTPTSTITFSGIPTDKYKHLQIRASAHSTSSVETTGLWMQFNSDSGSNKYMYSGQKDVAGFTPGGFGTPNTDLIVVGQIKGNSDSSVTNSAHIIDIYNAFSTNTFKSTKFYSGHTGSTTTSGRNVLLWGGGTWDSTSAINEINFTIQSGSFESGTVFSLYGYN